MCDKASGYSPYGDDRGEKSFRERKWNQKKSSSLKEKKKDVRREIERVLTRKKDMKRQIDDLMKILVLKPEGIVERMSSGLDEVVGSSIQSHQTPDSTIAEVVFRICSYIAALMTCKSPMQCAAVTISTVSQYFTMDSMKFLSDYVNNGFGELRPEADFAQLFKFFRDGTTALANIPFASILVDSLGMLCFSVLAGEKKANVSTLSDFISSLALNLKERIASKNFLESIADIFQYCVTACEHFASGFSIRKFFMPETIHDRYTELVTRKRMHDSGNLYEGRTISLPTLVNDARKLTSDIEYSIGRSKKPAIRLAYDRYLLELKTMIESVENDMKTARLRQQPYSVFLQGPPRSGKSMVVETVIGMLEHQTGRKIPDENRCYAAEFSKWDDTAKSTTDVVIIDDLGNTKLDKVPANETVQSRLATMINNTPSPIRRADLEGKGKHWWSHQMTIVTSNTMTGCFDQVSNCPESLVKRFRFFKFEVLDEYKKPDGSFDNSKAQYIDNGECAIPVPTNKIVRYEVEFRMGRPTIVEQEVFPDNRSWLKWLSEDIAKWDEEQKLYLRSMKGIREFPKCPKCGIFNDPRWCVCAPVSEKEKKDVVLKEQSMAIVGTFLRDAIFRDALLHMTDFFSRRHFPTLFGSLDTACGYLFLLVLRQIYEIYVDMTYKAKFSAFITTAVSLYCVYFFLTSLPCYAFVALCCFQLVFLYCSLSGIRHAVKRTIERQFRRALNVGEMPTLLVGALATGGMIYTFRRLLMAFVTFTAQGTLSPTSKEETEERKKEPDPWARPQPPRYSIPKRVSSMTVDEMKHNVSKCLFRWRYIHEDLATGSNALFISNRICAVPRHVWNSVKKTADEHGIEDIRIRLWKNPDDGSRFEAYVHAWEPVLDDDSNATDTVLLQLTNGPPTPDIIHYFNNDQLPESVSIMLTREVDGGITERSLCYREDGKVRAIGPIPSMYGSMHTICSATGDGSCSSPIISKSPKCISSLHHAGGSTIGKHYGVSHRIKRKWLENAHYRIVSINAEGEPWFRMPDAFSDGIELSPFDEPELRVDDELDERHPIAYKEEMEADGLAFVGYARGMRVTPFSHMKETPLLGPLIQEGMEKTHCRPLMRSNRDHGAVMEIPRMSVIEPSLLNKAFQDFVAPFSDLALSQGYTKVRPLTLHEALNGRPNSRFIGPIDETKAGGFGTKGKKEERLVIDFDIDTGRKILYAKPCLSDQIDKTLAEARTGYISRSLVRTAVKDEAVKLDPTTGLPAKRNRIFYVHPLYSFIALKMYCAPILEFIMLNPLMFECAAGINCTNDEWDQLARWLGSYGPNFIETDYSKYDVRLSGQMLRYASAVFQYVAKCIGYSPEDIDVLRVLLSDVVISAFMFNGALIISDGINPSGTHVTVMFNGFPNSAIYRCAYYCKQRDVPSMPSDFRSSVRLITMGDDSAAASMIRSFNMITIADFCNEVGMKVTTGTKGGIDEEFITFNDLSFCKRGFVYNDIVKCYIAPLNLTSIYKRLYLVQESTTDMETLMVGNVDTALRDLAFHDRETFNKHWSIITNACKRIGIFHLLKYGEFSYDQWWALFKFDNFAHSARLPPLVTV